MNEDNIKLNKNPWSKSEDEDMVNPRTFDDMLPDFADMLAYFQVYPDKFLDYINPEDSKFKLYPFQRVYLRILARYRKVFITATRGTSKSFLNILSLYLKCMMYPDIQLSVIAPQKQQAANITQANIEAIWNFLPILKNEVRKYTDAKDYTRLIFHNNSSIDVVAVSQGSRGLRRHGLSFEEIVQMDKHREDIGEVILPLLANNRKGADGKVSKYELHKQIFYITTASSRQAYAWEQLSSVMMEMANGKSAFVIGNDWKLPVMFEQLDPEYVDEVKNDPTVSPLQFAREYLSVYTGSSENSLVQLQDLESCRVLPKSEFEGKIKKNEEHKYVISVDVARSEHKKTATTAIAIFKITPRGNGSYVKHLVNLQTYKGNMHFEEQSLYIKELVDKYQASMVVVDGNGLGNGLIDYLVKEDRYPSYSVVNDKTYDKYKQPNSLPLIFNVKSSTSDTNSSDIHNHFMATISNHDLKILINENTFKEKTKEKDSERMAQKMIPHIETSLFIDEVMNLTYEAQGNRTKVKPVSRQMGKDRYSAISYGLYYIYLEEKKNDEKKRQTFDASGMIAIKQPKFKVFD